jgi:YggT family protein
VGEFTDCQDGRFLAFRPRGGYSFASHVQQGQPMYPFIWLIIRLIDIYWWIVIAAVILSWLLAFNVVNIHNPFVRQFSYVLARLTEPFLVYIRRFIPSIGGLDFSPLVLLFGLSVIRFFIIYYTATVV